MRKTSLLAVLGGLCVLCVSPAVAQSLATGSEAESFRDSVLKYYGFREKASAAVRAEIVRLEIEDWDSNTGGVTWDPKLKVLKLNGTNQQAAVTAFAKVWWDVSQSSKAAAGAAIAAEVAKVPGLKKQFGRLKGGELYAALAGWTMGAYKSGIHALPRTLWKHFDPMFTGHLYRTPWYDGGIP